MVVTMLLNYNALFNTDIVVVDRSNLVNSLEDFMGKHIAPIFLSSHEFTSFFKEIANGKYPHLDPIYSQVYNRSQQLTSDKEMKEVNLAQGIPDWGIEYMMQGKVAIVASSDIFMYVLKSFCQQLNTTFWLSQQRFLHINSALGFSKKLDPKIKQRIIQL